MGLPPSRSTIRCCSSMSNNGWMMAAQVMYTLREALGIKGVIFTVNQQPLRVPRR